VTPKEVNQNLCPASKNIHILLLPQDISLRASASDKPTYNYP
jgi:hypothetical protein